MAVIIGLKVTAANTDKETPRWKRLLRGAGLVLFLIACAGFGAGLSLLSNFYGARNLGQVLSSIGKTGQVLRDPTAAFPGRTSLNILCLGLDRNIVRSRNIRHNGMPSTKNARTDVMMVAHVDLAEKRISVLSIPRDTRVTIPGSRYATKINDAHARGGIDLTIRTVEEFLGIKIDHHAVIKQEALEEVVDALGGVYLDVEKDMDYDDNWGRLHIHLKKGPQLLQGEQIAGYMRFRHDREGDFGRIRRQQQVIKTLAQQARQPAVLLKANAVIDGIRRQIKTDLTPDQQLGLAYLMQSVGQENIQTVSLPVSDTPIIDGISYVVANDQAKENVVSWLFRGDDGAMNRLIRIELRNNSGDPALYERTVTCLRRFGFRVERAGRAGAGSDAGLTRLVQHKRLNGAARRVAEVLGLNAVWERDSAENADVTLYVGGDLASNRIISDDMLWPQQDEGPSVVSRTLPRRVLRPPVQVPAVPEFPQEETTTLGDSMTEWDEPKLERDLPGDEPLSTGRDEMPDDPLESEFDNSDPGAA